MPTILQRYTTTALLCALIAAALFLPGLGGDFLLDDKPTILDNPAVQVTTLDPGRLTQAAYSFAAGGGTRALPMLTFALDYWRAGLDPAAFKATNIALHALTTLVLALFLRLLLGMAGWPERRARFSALAIAVAWAIHPLQVSSVLYIVQRMQTMGTLFLVLAMHAYLKMRQAQIADRPGRQYGVLAGLCWVLALACKEDSILLPACTLALELTLLRFGAAQPATARAIRKAYVVLVVLGLAVFLLYALPHFWSAGPYPGRDFSTPERLLTQGRVLAMYLGQIVWPWPGHMPFYYDDLQPSRGLLQSWTTLPALLLVAGLLALAWGLRHRRPVFALGIFLFFAGHAIASNILGLELAFEHRNHFPLVGAMLALGDLLALAAERLRIRPIHAAIAGGAILLGLGAATLSRVAAWGSPIGFAEYGIRLAPTSERAWINLCETHFRLSGDRPSDPHFAKALDACGKGAMLPDGATNLTNLVLLKTIDGSVRQADWERLFDRMRHVTMTPSNAGVAWHLVRYSNGDPRIDRRNVIDIVDIVDKRAPFHPEEYVALGYYAAKNHMDQDAFRYFVQAVRSSPPGSTLPMALVADLRAEHMPDVAKRLLQVIEPGAQPGAPAGR